ncbi:MAG: antibiotic biosynthesis monooxygenase [Salinigranum sp.]
MIVVSNRFNVAEGHEEQFVERFRESTGGVEDREGFVRFELQTPVKGDTYAVTTYWESMEDFEAWTDSEEFERAHAREAPEGMFEGHPELEIHEVAFERTRD